MQYNFEKQYSLAIAKIATNLLEKTLQLIVPW